MIKFSANKFTYNGLREITEKEARQANALGIEVYASFDLSLRILPEKLKWFWGTRNCAAFKIIPYSAGNSLWKTDEDDMDLCFLAVDGCTTTPFTSVTKKSLTGRHAILFPKELTYFVENTNVTLQGGQRDIEEKDPCQFMLL